MTDVPVEVQPPEGGLPAPGATEDPEEERRRRRKFFLLFFLALLAALFLAIGIWYLIFRKPIDQIIPPITVDKVPHYAWSIYGLDRPMGIAVTDDGNRIYVSESSGDRVVKIFDDRGKEIGRLVPPNTEPGSRIPVYLAIDPLTQDVYVTDRWVQGIEIFDKTGTFKGLYEPDPTVGPWQPLGITFDGAGTLFVSDVLGDVHRVLAFDRDRKLIRTIGLDEGLKFPNGLAVDSLGNLAIADGNNGRVVIMSPSDVQLGIIGRGFAQGELALPRGAAIDGDGRLYISDVTAHVVQLYKLAAGVPSYYATVGHEGIDESGFEYPHGLALDGRASVYIADWANNRVDVWTY
jgi:DNA-binding beta-propeller fold protein YncE